MFQQKWLSKITDKIIPLIEEWQSRPLEEVYYFTFLDAVHFHVKEDKTIVKKAAYIVLGVNSERKKERCPGNLYRRK